ncbi:hypothetical protein SLA2020_355130 [Shorea laevis]
MGNLRQTLRVLAPGQITPACTPPPAWPKDTISAGKFSTGLQLQMMSSLANSPLSTFSDHRELSTIVASSVLHGSEEHHHGISILD